MACDVYENHLRPNKLDPKSDKCYVVRYAQNTVGHQSQSGCREENGAFLEKEFLEKELGGRTIQLAEIVESLKIVEMVEEVEVVPYIIPKTKPEPLVLDNGIRKFVSKPRKTNIVR